MIAELANASGIAGMAGGQALDLWRQKASGSLSGRAETHSSPWADSFAPPLDLAR